LEGSSKDGKNDGLVTEWSKSGKIIYQEHFKNGNEQ